MIQRLQSLFLLTVSAAAILFLLTNAGISSGIAAIGNTETNFSINAMESHFSETTENNSLIIAAFAISALFSLVIIFLYKNLKLQQTLTSVNFILILSCLLSIYLTRNGVYKNFTVIRSANLSGWLTLPISMLIFNYLALKYIKKDIALISSVDRLR